MLVGMGPIGKNWWWRREQGNFWSDILKEGKEDGIHCMGRKAGQLTEREHGSWGQVALQARAVRECLWVAIGKSQPCPPTSHRLMGLLGKSVKSRVYRFLGAFCLGLWWIQFLFILFKTWNPSWCLISYPESVGYCQIKPPGPVKLKVFKWNIICLKQSVQSFLLSLRI